MAKIVFFSAALGAALFVAGAAAQSGPPTPTVNATIVNTNPIPVATPTETHMGVPPTEHVNLGLVGRAENTALCGTGGATFSRRLADGTRLSEPFVVPEGKALVITDIGAGVIAAQGSPWSLGQLVTVDLRFGVDVPPIGIQWQTTIVVDAAVAAAQRLWVNERVLSGVVFGPGQVVCMKAGLGLEAGNGNASLTTLNRLHGYLTPYRP